jgi:hypothetical protein
MPKELSIFPAVEGVTPLVADAYAKDHRGLDAAFESLSSAVSARDALGTARATAAFKFHLDIHLYKEGSHPYRIIRERVTVPDQGKAVTVMSAQFRGIAFLSWSHGCTRCWISTTERT